MERVLFINSTRIGDAIINSGVLRHLVETRPNASFTIACGPLAAPLFEAVPRLERIIVMAKKKRGAHWMDLWKDTVGLKWDLVVDMRCSATGWFLRANERRILSQSKTPIPKVEEAASVLGLNPPVDPIIWLTEDAKARAAELFPDDQPVVAVCPSASAPYKVWPGPRFGELVSRLIAEDGPMPGGRVMIQGGPFDHEAAEPIHAALPDADIVDLTGGGLMDAAATLSHARLYVGNDSGLMHMAAAVGVPTLGLFGPSDHKRYAPWGEHCEMVRGEISFEEHDSAHDDRRKVEESLLKDLTVDTAYEAACRLFERTQA